MKKGIDSIFKVMLYRPYHFDKQKLQYPTFKVYGNEVVYFRTLGEVECYIQTEARSNDGACFDLYAFVVVEIPLGLEVKMEQNLSVRIYLPDGTLWGSQLYSNFIPSYGLTPELYNYWERKNTFKGRTAEEIKFKPGDIVEILGYPGNSYWTPDEVNLGIIVKTPPTREEVTWMRHHTSNTTFGYHLDTYEVLSLVCDEIDHAPTISVFKLTLEVPKREKEALMRMYKNIV